MQHTAEELTAEQGRYELSARNYRAEAKRYEGRTREAFESKARAAERSAGEIRSYLETTLNIAHEQALTEDRAKASLTGDQVAARCDADTIRDPFEQGSIEGKLLVDRARRLSVRADRSFRRWVSGEVDSDAYARRMQRECDEAWADVRLYVVDGFDIESAEAGR